jgi:hypothetical protein
MADTTADGDRWMTYAELATVRGISRASASRLVRRRKWRRQTDNQGNVRILVPVAESERPDNPMDIVRMLDATFREQIEHERNRAERAESRAEAAEQALAAERGRADILRDRLGEAERADEAQKARGRWRRLRAAWRGE